MMKTDQKLSTLFRPLVAIALILMTAIAVMAAPAPKALADPLTGQSLSTQRDEPVKGTDENGIGWEIYFDGTDHATSVWIVSYTGSATTVVVPEAVKINGETISLEGSWIEIFPSAFQGNTKIESVVLTSDVKDIQDEAFSGCTGLKTIVIEGAEGSNEYDKLTFGTNVFAGCSNLKNYYFGKNITSNTVSGLEKASIGQTPSNDGATYTVYPGVTVYTKSGSPVETYIKTVNAGSDTKITIVTDDDAYKTGVEKVAPSNAGDNGNSNSSNSSSSTSADSKPATPYSPGATASQVNKALTKWSSEADPAGTQFFLLQAKSTKVTNNSLKLQWTKAKGVKKYVIYGNKCGKKNKMVKLMTTKKTSNVFKKVNKKAVKKGTYYKFYVVALDKNNKVISTSKSVHVATSGGKVGNDKKVTTAAKKNKVTVKVKKTFKLNGKEVAASKKLTVKHHRGVAYESTNPQIASVTKKGVVKGLKKGTCYVYAYAQNGVFAKVKVTVK